MRFGPFHPTSQQIGAVGHLQSRRAVGYELHRSIRYTTAEQLRQLRVRWKIVGQISKELSARGCSDRCARKLLGEPLVGSFAVLCNLVLPLAQFGVMFGSRRLPAGWLLLELLAGPDHEPYLRRIHMQDRDAYLGKLIQGSLAVSTRRVLRRRAL